MGRISPFLPFLRQGGFPAFAQHSFSLSEDPSKAGSQGDGTGVINGSGQPPVGTKPAHPLHPAALSHAHRAGRGARPVLAVPACHLSPAAAHTHVRQHAAGRRKRLSCKKFRVFFFFSCSQRKGKSPSPAPKLLAPGEKPARRLQPSPPWDEALPAPSVTPSLCPFRSGRTMSSRLIATALAPSFSSTVPIAAGPPPSCRRAELPRSVTIRALPTPSAARRQRAPCPGEGAALRPGALVSERALGSPSPRSALSALSTCLHSNPPRKLSWLGGDSLSPAGRNP